MKDENDTRVFLFARHGETEWNAAGRWQGQTDVPLNERGRAQAGRLGLRLRDAGDRLVEALACSDLSRARETAEIAGRALGLVVSHVEPAFRERAYGIFEGLTREECVARYPREWIQFQEDPSLPPPSVEPLDHVAARMLAGLRAMVIRPERSWLVVSHGRAIRALANAITPDAAPMPLGNGGVYRIVVERGEPVAAVLAFDPGFDG